VGLHCSLLSGSTTGGSLRRVRRRWPDLARIAIDGNAGDAGKIVFHVLEGQQAHIRIVSLLEPGRHVYPVVAARRD
jgi:hypothetical protein